MGRVAGKHKMQKKGIERDDKLTSPKLLNKHVPAENFQTNGGIASLKGWKQVGFYSSYFIYASGDIRRVIDPAAGRIIVQYRTPAIKKV